MSLILIHTDYQEESSLCPVCNMNKGEIRRNSLTLCRQCDTTALKPDPVAAIQPGARANFIARGMLWLAYGIAVIVMDLGFAIRAISRSVRSSGSGQGRHSPCSQTGNRAGQSPEGACLRACKI